MTDQDKAAPEYDPLADLITDMHERIQRLESGQVAMQKMLQGLADECGYELERVEQAGGRVFVQWKAKSQIVRV